jgi:hypothetical protein
MRRLTETEDNTNFITTLIQADFSPDPATMPLTESCQRLRLASLVKTEKKKKLLVTFFHAHSLLFSSSFFF